MAQNLFNSDLHEDSKNGDLRKVKRWLERGTPVNSRKEGYTALHRACQFGHLEVVRFLLEKGADLHARTFGYYTPLHWASAGGFREVTEFLLEQGADPSARLQNGQLAEELAIEAGHSELAEFLNSKLKEDRLTHAATDHQNDPNFQNKNQNAENGSGGGNWEHERLRAEASGTYHFSGHVFLNGPDRTTTTTTTFLSVEPVSAKESSENSFQSSDQSSSDSNGSRARYNTLLPSTEEEITKYKHEMKERYEKQMQEEAGKKIMDLSHLTKKAKKASFFWKK